MNVQLVATGAGETAGFDHDCVIPKVGTRPYKDARVADLGYIRHSCQNSNVQSLPVLS